MYGEGSSLMYGEGKAGAAKTIQHDK